MSNNTILLDIIENKKRELEKAKDIYKCKENKYSYSTKSLLSSITSVYYDKKHSIIAEIKKASPSRGVLLEDFDPLKLARIYEENGAVAISVLTESKFFQGDIRFLSQVRKITGLPLLRKDFIIHESQIYESRFMGADAILLIAAVLKDEDRCKQFYNIAKDLELEVLFEVHNEIELELAVNIGVDIIGINNRNLENFKTDIAVTLEMISYIPEGIAIVSESGIYNIDQVKTLSKRGVDAFLIGESLISARDIGKKLRELSL